MTLQLPITYDDLLLLLDQLPVEEQQSIASYLAEKTKMVLSNRDKKSLYHASILDTPVNEAPSVRRSDWYDDDGR